MGNEYQSLTTHTKKIRRDHYHPKKGKHSHQNQKDNPIRDLSSVICYTCDEKGHITINYPRNRGGSHKKNNKRRHHAHTVEDDEPPRKRVKEESEDSSSNEEFKRRHRVHTTEDDEPPRKRVKEESEDSSSDEEYVLISSLT